ncbi:FRG domain-containing protein [Runella sp. MFBS21]|uniref:FRG domain-containing protein n=1 Tax=Runella sp. MFBS21 TaxID=3034018 RepID=UPI0023F67235|nr:FRG domain-containing protein [Runella sp. MFBS21]MDF7822255.1 FRG domain-containing protein [Runella sp. MFBS21]
MNLLTLPAWTDFLLNIRQAQHELGNPDTIWFRGHGNVNHYLLPSLLRFKNGLDKEQEIFYKFRRFADKIFVNKESEWETLFDMQHYGIPTRLLDWTETLGIALYFAAYNNQIYKVHGNAAVYLLNPIKLNTKSGINKIYRLPYEENKYSYSKIYWEKTPMKANAPIAIEPIFRNDRILAQRGMFTVHHDDIAPIEDVFPDSIKKVILPGDAIESVQEFLKIANIDEFSVFPDLSGVAGFMNKTSGLESRW